MATWIKQPWIENALKSTANSLPKIARAQVLKLEETSNIAVISDKKLFVKAEFSSTAIEQFKRDNSSLQLSDIQGGLIFVKKYTVRATAENELDHAEFVINIDEFKFAGGEGNTQFGSDVTDSSTHPQLKSRLWQLWREGQLRKQLVEGEANVPDPKEAERLLLHNHNEIFIPDDMERKLAEIPEWKPGYIPPQTYEMQSDISSLESKVQEESCPNSTDLAEHATAEKEHEKCTSKEHSYEDKPLVSSSCVPSSQREVHRTVEQPLIGLWPEELCSSSSETSQLKGSSEESYSILQRRSSVAENAPDFSIEPSSQNSDEYELEQALPHVTPERKQFNCSLSESQLESFLDASVSFDEVTVPPCFSDVSPSIQKGFTEIKPRDARQRKSTSCDKLKSTSESSHSKSFADNELSLASNRGSEKESRSNNKDSASYNVAKEVVVVSSVRDNIRNTLHRKQSFETAKVDFDALFSQNTWKHSQTPVQEYSAEVFEIDKRQSVKRKRSDKDDSNHNLPGLSVGVRQVRKLSFPDSPVSPDSTSDSLKSSSQSVSSQSQRSNQSSIKPEDLYTQQDPLFLDTSGSAESLKSLQDHEETSPSILEISMEEPCTLSTPNFDSLPSYQVPDDTSLPRSRGQKDELFASTTRKQEAGPLQEPGTSGAFAENVMKPAGVKKKRKVRRNFNWFSDAY